VRIRTCITIDAPPAEVWTAVSRIDTHVEWMRDARSIRLLEPAGRRRKLRLLLRRSAKPPSRGWRRTGVGTRFECVTGIGPFLTTDLLVVTEWRRLRAIGISHQGAVRGRGRFTLHRRRGGRTRFCWRERLRFPWWMGGPLGELLAWPLLRATWKGNLRRLKARVEHG
jgi:Polyketide cyclase / dehydrase and lipid transport